MGKIVLIVDHPSFAQSVVNRRWLDEVKKYPDEFLIHNLQSVYPSGSIDAAAEHSIIDNNDGVVLQFPMYWFNSPPLMKKWIDTVFSPGWAYRGGNKLKDKKFAFAVSCGGSEQDYSKDGDVGMSVLDLLNSYVCSLAYVQADFRGLYTFYDAIPQGPALEASAVASSARNYIDFLRQSFN